jgi:hypothetical protein
MASTQVITEGNTRSTAKIYQSPTDAAQNKKEIMLQNLRQTHKIRKTVTTIYKVQQFYQTILTRLIKAE